MNDDFYFSGLKDDGWFGRNFEDYHLFGYVGDRDRLSAALQKKSLFRQLVERAVSHVSIGALINQLASFDLVKVAEDKTLAKQIVDVVTNHENSRTLTELLRSTYKNGKKQGRYFDCVSKSIGNDRPLFSADFNKIQDQLITVEGQLLHRTTVTQYNPTLSATLNASQGEWVLADVPPHGLVAGNQRFSGKVLVLSEDQGFGRAFEDYLPFCRGVGWYPYVRITGFFDSSRLQTEILPRLSISLAEYRRPRLYLEQRASLISFAEQQMRPQYKGPYFETWSERLLFSYLFPLVLRGSNLTEAHAEPDVSSLLQNYVSLVGEDLPATLAPFYSSMDR